MNVWIREYVITLDKNLIQLVKMPCKRKQKQLWVFQRENKNILRTLKSGTLSMLHVLYSFVCLFLFSLFAQDLHVSGVVSSNVLETIKNAEEFIELREYRTAAAILTVVLQQPDNHDPQLLASLYCRRAECLLHMVSAGVLAVPLHKLISQCMRA